MNNEFEGKERIESPEEFKKLVKNNKKDFSNCAFMFAFSGSDSELLIKTFTNKASKFDGAVFTKEVKFYKIDIPNDITFNNITFQETLTFDSVNFSGNFCAMGCTFHDIELIASPLENKKLELTKNNFRGNIKISQRDMGQGNDELSGKKVEKVKISELLFKNNKLTTGQLVEFYYLDVTDFHFENTNNPVASQINIGDCDFNTFTIYKLINSGKFRIYSMNANKEELKSEEFKLIDSYLGDGDLQNVNFKCYKKWYMKDSFLSDLQYSRVEWPTPDTIRLEGIDTDEQIRDAFRNVKNMARKSNDAPRAIAFYAKEMEAYSRTLSWQKGQIIDKLILLFNRGTNKFGLNWLWPIGWILGFGLVLYTLLLLSCSYIDSPGVWGKFFVFLNPAHKTEFVCKGNWGFFTYFFDFVFRLIEAALIFQTTIAFKKYTSKL